MISSKELIEEIRQQGYKLELRTLRDYVNRGLLPKPIAQKRQQEKGQGGGMIAFYPNKTKEMLDTILENRGQGLSLKGIKKKLYDQESWEFSQIFFGLSAAGRFSIGDIHLMEMNRYGEQKLSPYGEAFRKYLDDGFIRTEILYKFAKNQTSNSAYGLLDKEPEDLYAVGIMENFQKLRTLYLAIYGWDREEKEKYLINYAIKHLRESFLVQFNSFAAINKLTENLDKRLLKTKSGNLILKHIEMFSDELETLSEGIENLENTLHSLEEG